MTDPDGTNELNSIIEEDNGEAQKDNNPKGDKATTLEISWDNLETTKKEGNKNPEIR